MGRTYSRVTVGIVAVYVLLLGHFLFSSFVFTLGPTLAIPANYGPYACPAYIIEGGPPLVSTTNAYWQHKGFPFQLAHLETQDCPAFIINDWAFTVPAILLDGAYTLLLTVVLLAILIIRAGPGATVRAIANLSKRFIGSKSEALVIGVGMLLLGHLAFADFVTSAGLALPPLEALRVQHEAASEVHTGCVMVGNSVFANPSLTDTSDSLSSDTAKGFPMRWVWLDDYCLDDTLWRLAPSAVIIDATYAAAIILACVVLYLRQRARRRVGSDFPIA